MYTLINLSLSLSCSTCSSVHKCVCVCVLPFAINCSLSIAVQRVLLTQICSTCLSDQNSPPTPMDFSSPPLFSINISNYCGSFFVNCLLFIIIIIIIINDDDDDVNKNKLNILGFCFLSNFTSGNIFVFYFMKHCQSLIFFFFFGIL